MARRIIIIGGGAAGMGAAGAAQGVDPGGRDHRLHRLRGCRLQPVRHSLRARQGDPVLREPVPGHQAGVRRPGARHPLRDERGIVRPHGEDGHPTDGATERYDSLVLATGFEYADPGVPGGDLGGIYYVKNIRRAMEWDVVLDGVKAAVVDECTPLGAEMVTALAHRGIETHLVDPAPWGMSMATDPDIMAPVQESWEEMGVNLHFNTKVTAFQGDAGKVTSVATTGGEIAADLVVPATHKEPNTRLALAAGVKTGMSGGIIVDDQMRTSLPRRLRRG